MKLIDKDALVAEIDNILDYADEHWDTDLVIGAQRFANKLQDAIDTLEVKEVNDEPECKIFPRPVECYSTCKECPYAVINNKV